MHMARNAGGNRGGGFSGGSSGSGRSSSSGRSSQGRPSQGGSSRGGSQRSGGQGGGHSGGGHGDGAHGGSHGGVSASRAGQQGARGQQQGGHKQQGARGGAQVSGAAQGSLGGQAGRTQQVGHGQQAAHGGAQAGHSQQSARNQQQAARGKQQAAARGGQPAHGSHVYRTQPARGGAPHGKPAPAPKPAVARVPGPAPAPKPTPSSSLCPVARDCGACQLIDVPYEQQLADKDARVAELFAQVADPDVLRPILGMDDPFHYRNKVSAPFAPGKRIAPAPGAAGRGGQGAGRRQPQAPQREILCGMYAQGSHRIVPSDSCLVENETARKVVLAVRDLMPRFGIEPYDEDAGEGFLRHVVVRVGHTSGEVLVTLVTNGSMFPASKAFCRELMERCPAITTIVQNVNERDTNVILGEREQRLYGPGFILDKLCGLSFRISSKSFYQVNSMQTEVLYEQAIELAGLTGSENVIDAYCGTGTIGLVAAKSGAAEVLGVDSESSAIRDARQNASHNGIENASFVAADAGRFLRELAAEGDHVDVLLMDPPRAGSSPEFLDAAVQLAPSRIVYISCNPRTQVRDIEDLLEGGYVVSAVQPVDMFPHTEHIESIALLTREGGVWESGGEDEAATDEGVAGEDAGWGVEDEAAAGDYYEDEL